MPSSAAHGMHASSFTLSRILFRSNKTSGNIPEIPLGLISELVVGPCRVLGMSIRRAITPAELSWLPDIWHADLAHPAAFWSRQFDEAWASAVAGQALNILAERHTDPVLVTPPQPCSLPPFRAGDSDLRDDAVLAVLGLLVREEDNFLSKKPTYLQVESEITNTRFYSTIPPET